MATYAQAALQATLETPLGKDKLLLRSFSGEEKISGLFHFELEMRSEDPDVDFSQIVGKSATITLYLSDDGKRYLNGLVASFTYAGTSHQPGTEKGFAIYHAQLVPWLWILTLETDSKIFQNKSVPDIVEQVFTDMGFTDFKRSLTGTYDPREYCVQYQETAFAFVSRLLEDEGIFYYFEHADGKHTLVLADDSTAATACPSGGTLAYGASSTWVQQEVATGCRLEERVIPGKYAMDDFNFETPSTDLIASVDSTVAKDGAKRRLYEYPGGFLKKDKGEARGKLRIEGQEVPAKLLLGDSNSRTLATGYKFTLSGHARNEINADWVLSRVVHSGTPEGYGNSFEAFPSTVPYRPPRVTPRPIIPGTQTAIVTGKSGEEIWTDKYGRVTVQFHWDQVGKNDETSSCWIRVAHGWAGKSWGQIFLPRVGQEVVVSFLEGDPDRPLITGSVYNAEQTVPYALPGEQTKSTVKSNSSKGGGGSNEIRFEDKKDSEEIYVHAQKDENIVVEHDRTKKVLNDETITIKNNRTATIEEKDESLTVAKGNRTVKVSTGNETHEVAGTRAVKVTKAETHDDADDFTHTVTKNYTLKVSGDISIEATGAITIKAGKGFTMEAGQAMSAKAGTSFTNKAGTELTNQAGTALTNKAGTDLTNKATTSMTNDGGISLTNKASASQTVDGGGMLTVKGGLVKIN
ncbi:MAG TPA: type VI secretion system tip protein TssI/VgrG [Thermoanaerobaculia bacterium]|nr:type VI secretion system tip protein TssI/VgrG [Thermoanaerobaculia bacterium]